MRLSAQEEYGLRCLVSMARAGGDGSVTIAQISQAEGLSPAHVAKLLRPLREAGLVESVRGKEGGYRLARPTRRITVREALDVLGGRFFGPGFCENHAGVRRECVHSTDCAIRPLLAAVQSVLDGVFGKMTLADLLCSEREASARVTYRIANNLL